MKLQATGLHLHLSCAVMLLGNFFAASSVDASLVNINDQLNVDNPNITVAEEGGVNDSFFTSCVGQSVDDTYSGTICMDVTISMDSLANGSGASGFTAFQLYNNGNESLAVGDYWGGTHWGGFRLGGSFSGHPIDDYTFDTTNDVFVGGDSGDDTLVTNDPRTFKLTIDYNAGGLDDLTISYAGNVFTTQGDYAFDEITVRSGNNGTQVADFTGMRLSVVPEPSAFGLLGMCLLPVLFRRKRS